MTCDDDAAYDLTALKVGDEVLVRSSYYSEAARRSGRPEPEPKWYPIEKVGRKLLHVRVTGYGLIQRFDRADGAESRSQNSIDAGDRAFTEAGYQHFLHRRDVQERIGAATSGYGWRARLTVDQLERIAAILDEDSAA